MSAAVATISPDLELADFVAQFYGDPLRFVIGCYPWGKAGGPLEHSKGPDALQREFLVSLGKEVKSRHFDGKNPVAPIRMAESSGHGTGKSSMGAWLAAWILSTRPGSVGTVTAGTATQLEERTWAAITWWTKLCITSHWFDFQARGIYAKTDPENWKIVAQTCKEENAQSFAGQHARTSTSWYLFDEASTVPDGIWKVAYGGLTDGEPMMFAWGQPERNTGQFYEICFGRERDRWNHRTVDSRASAFTNKELINEWLRDYGEDSDWSRVRIFGLPPRANELQYIDKQRIADAQRRTVQPLETEPLIAGVDVSGGGAAWNVIRFRRGLDARSIRPIRIPGEQGRDREMLITKCADLLADRTAERRISAMFIDSAFGAPVAERLRVLGYQNVHEVNFGGHAPDQHEANMRAYMYRQVKDWLQRGAIDAGDERLAIDLSTPGYHINTSGKLVIESKEQVVKRLGRSPDDADALALTFARAVAPEEPEYHAPPRYRGADSWMGF
jgi:hypothetical protein